MKGLAVTLMLLGSAGSSSAAEQWLRGAPAIWPGSAVPEALPLSSHVELPVSIFESAERELRDNSAVKLPAYGPANFLRRDFVCPDHSQPYLVRAVYTNGATGGYHLSRAGNALWVSHQSLGQSTGYHRSALLACLPFEPSEVYVTAGGAM